VNDGPATSAQPGHAVANLRRSVWLAAPVAVVAVVVSAVLGHPWVGVFVVVGLAMGAANTALVQRSVARFAVATRPNRKQRFVGGVFGRLLAVTAVALVILLLFHPDGIGVLGGLAVFQLLMVGSASLPVIKELRKA
jgi:hypothetical protein